MLLNVTIFFNFPVSVAENTQANVNIYLNPLQREYDETQNVLFELKCLGLIIQCFVSYQTANLAIRCIRCY